MYERSARRQSRGRPRRRPRSQQRERVLRLVHEHDGAADAAELAGRLGLHVSTVRFHLDALCEERAVARVRVDPTGVGRPRVGYVPVRDRLDYRTLAQVLVMELGDTVAERRERAERAGRRWAVRIHAEDPFGAVESLNSPARADPDRGVDAQAVTLARVFDLMGFEPELDPGSDYTESRRDRTIRFHGCPVRELARDHPEICALHLGLLRGLVGDRSDTERGAPSRTHLDPFVEPELCTARVIAGDPQ